MRCLLPRLKEKCLYFLGCPHRQPRGSLPPPGRAAGAAACQSPGSPPAAPRDWGGGYAWLLGGDGSGRRVSQWAPQKSPFGERVLGSGRGPASEGGAREPWPGAGTRRSGLRGPPLSPADGDLRPKGSGRGNRGDPDGGTGCISPPRSPRPLPRSPLCPPRLTPWIPPPEAALPDGAGGKDAVGSSEVIINSRAHRGGRGGR